MTYVRSDILESSINAMRTDQFYFKNVDYVTDSGWFFTDKDTKHSVQFDYNNNFMHPLRPMYTFSTQVTLSYIKDIYTRQYIKVQEALASALGIFEIAIAIASIFHSLYVDKLFLNHLLSHFLKKSDFHKSNGINIEMGYINNRLNNSNHIVIAESNPLRPSQIIPNEIKLNETKQKRKWEYFVYEVLCLWRKERRQNVRYLERFEKLYSKALDVKTFLKNSLKMKINDRIFFDSKSIALKRLSLYMYIAKYSKNEEWKLKELENHSNNKSTDDLIIKLYNNLT
jgi:hypothetical protein